MIGIDEVGRGCWAGPLVVGAVRLHKPVAGLKDSKKLTAKKRQYLAGIIYKNADVGLGWIMPSQIDRHGLSWALKTAAIDAYKQIYRSAQEPVIIDGTVNFLGSKIVTCLKKADDLVMEVSAASIVAKVARDEYMSKLDAKHPGYGFSCHVGYGTARHRAALTSLGPIVSVHRFSYRPIRNLRKVEF